MRRPTGRPWPWGSPSIAAPTTRRGSPAGGPLALRAPVTRGVPFFESASEPEGSDQVDRGSCREFAPCGLKFFGSLPNCLSCIGGSLQNVERLFGPLDTRLDTGQ